MRAESRRERTPPPRLGERLLSPAGCYAAFVGFVAMVFLLGGGARADLLSLVLLRPLAVLVAGYALIAADWRAVARLGTPFWLLLALMGWMAAQLVPLPHGVWSTLPGRAIVADNDRVAGLGEIWRSLTLAPSRTRNSLFSLAVPLAVFLLVAAVDPARHHRLLWPVLAMAAVSAVLGLLQILGPHGGPLYLYRITSPDSPVGLFANRNHHAIFLASLIPLLAYVALRGGPRAPRRPLVIAACAGSVLFLVPLIIGTGSRGGALLLLLALVASAILWLAHLAPQPTRRGGRDPRRRFAVLGVVVVALGAVLVTYLASRSVALDRLLDESLDSDLRVRVLPQLLAMMKDYFPAGSGYGTFELAYKVIEPLQLLRTSYLNQAHNDAIQVVIEGGLPGTLLLALFLLWFARAGWRAWQRHRIDRARRDAAARIGPFAWTSLAILLLGSLADYPLRTPSLMAFAALLCFLLRPPGQAPARV